MTEIPTHLSVTDTLADIRRYFESFENHNYMVRIFARGPVFEFLTDKPGSVWEKWYTSGQDITDRAGFLKWNVQGPYLVMPGKEISGGRYSHACTLRVRLDDVKAIELYQPRTTLWMREFTK